MESLISTNIDETKTRQEAYLNEVFRGNNAQDKITLVESIVDKHYKSFKLDYMYNYLDFFSNKYKIRRKIAEEMKNKVTLTVIKFLNLLKGNKRIIE